MRWLSAAVLVAANLVPLVGVAFWGWSLMLILVLYWIESGIVGVLNVFKIARASGPSSIGAGGSRVTMRMTGMAAGLARGGIIGFFIFHYGMFWVVLGRSAELPRRPHRPRKQPSRPDSLARVADPSAPAQAGA